MEKRFIWKNVTGKNPALLCVMAAFLLAAVGCAELGPSPAEQNTQMQADIKKIANLPLDEFLPAYFTKSAGSYNTIDMGAFVQENKYDEILRPRRVLETYCDDNDAILLRIPNSQPDSWQEFSPDAFSDIRTAQNAKAMMSQLSGSAYGLAQASKMGAFGIFECRDIKTSRSLWKAEISQSETAVVDRDRQYRAFLRMKLKKCGEKSSLISGFMMCQ